MCACVQGPHRGPSHLPNNMWWCRDFLTPRFNQSLQFSSCDPWRVFSHSNSPPHCALGQYRHTSPSRQIFNIFSWLESLNYCPDGGNGDFQCFRYFLTATFYFVKLNNLVLYIRTIFLGFTSCDGWLREFCLCVTHTYNPVEEKSWLDNFMLLVTLECYKCKYEWEYTSEIVYA